jgi:hypothetical protein
MPKPQLSTNVNDYDTGEPILDGNIRKTLINYNNQKIENTIFSELYGIKVGSKYYAPGISENIIALDLKYQLHSHNLERRRQKNKNKNKL